MVRRLVIVVATTAIFLAAFIVWERYGPQIIAPDLGPKQEQVDHILIEKSARRLTAFRDGKPVLTFDIALGFGPVGTKKTEGDGKTPEGLFTIEDRKSVV